MMREVSHVCNYTLGIYADRYIVSVFLFVCSLVRSFSRFALFPSLRAPEFMPGGGGRDQILGHL